MGWIWDGEEEGSVENDPGLSNKGQCDLLGLEHCRVSSLVGRKKSLGLDY